MLNIELSFFKVDECPFVEVLTNDNATRTVGFKLGGHHPGPRIVVAGYFPVADAVYDRLVGLPTIGWMHGSLILIRLNELGDQTLDTYADLALDIRPDELIFLPYHSDAHNHEQAVNDGYWSILRLCAKLGMIAGRGIYDPQEVKTD